MNIVRSIFQFAIIVILIVSFYSCTTNAVAEYTLNIDVVGDGKVYVDGEPVTENEIFTSGTIIELSAIPEFSWVFNEWQGDHSDFQKITSVKMENDKHIIAEFVEGAEDIDGNFYEIVQIGPQLWMKENLRTSRYRDGSNLLSELEDSEWGSTSLGAYAIYPHELIPGFESDEDVADVFGYRYNWFAVGDDRGLCPDEWKIPNTDDWENLRKFLGDGNIGGQIKHTEYWEEPNSGASNSSEFSAVPGGGRYESGQYTHIGRFERLWSSSDDGDRGYRKGIAYSKAGADYYSRPKNRGFSVRCIADQ